MSNLTCGFIGLGLIGGSIAKAVKSCIPTSRLIAYDINSNSLELACKEQIIDQICPAIDDSFHDCDYLFLCAPVTHNDENLLALRPYLSPDTILTDVGSVKTGIHRQIEALHLQSQFIGGHPMAGSERLGNHIPKEKVTAYQDLVSSIGAIPLILSYEQHDYVTAAISHLPHVIAASLVNLIKSCDSEEGIMKMIAAGGFKDITRIASSSPAMWQQICMTNTENISGLLNAYIQYLTELSACIDNRNGDALYRFFDSARTYRDSFTNSSNGPIKAEYVLTVDIADKPGAIATLAALLAKHQVSIKNIGINHNRELAEGALRIEFYDKEAKKAAVRILTEHNYRIHTR